MKKIIFLTTIILSLHVLSISIAQAGLPVCGNNEPAIEITRQVYQYDNPGPPYEWHYWQFFKQFGGANLDGDPSNFTGSDRQTYDVKLSNFSSGPTDTDVIIIFTEEPNLSPVSSKIDAAYIKGLYQGRLDINTTTTIDIMQAADLTQYPFYENGNPITTVGKIFVVAVTPTCLAVGYDTATGDLIHYYFEP